MDTRSNQGYIWQLKKRGASHPHYLAMIYGYDGVDHMSDDPIVWFNRGAFAVVDEAMNLTDIKEMDKV
jgi:hypothetical protein